MPSLRSARALTLHAYSLLLGDEIIGWGVGAKPSQYGTVCSVYRGIFEIWSYSKFFFFFDKYWLYPKLL